MSNDIEQQFNSLPEVGQQQAPQGQQAAPDSGGGDIASQFNSLPEVGQDQGQPAVDSPGAFMAGVDAFNRQFGRVAEGLLQGFGKVTGMGTNTIDKVNAQNEAQYSANKATHPLATTIGNVAGGVGTGVMAMAAGGGVPAAGASLAKQAAIYGTQAGLLGASNYGTGGERIRNGIIAGTIGAALGAGTGLLSKGVSAIVGKNITPETAAIRAIGDEVKTEGGLPAMIARGADAKDVGINLDPTQQIGGTTVGNLLKGITPNTEEKTAIKAVLGKQQQQGQDAAMNIIKNMVPEGTEQANTLKNQLYKDLTPLQTNDDTMKTLMSDPSIATRLKSLNTNVDSTVRNLPDNSVLKLDEVKRSLDHDYNATSPDGKALLNPNQQAAVLQARNKIVDSLDAQFPQYQAARKVSERVITQRNYMDQLNKIPQQAGTKGATLDQMFTTLFGTPEKQTQFINDVKKTAFNDQIGQVEALKAQKVMSVLNDIRQSPLNSVLTKKASEGGMDMSKGIVTPVVQGLHRLVNGQYNHALLKMMTDPNWQDKVAASINGKTLSSKAEGLVKTIGQFLHGKGAVVPAATVINNAEQQPQQPTGLLGY